MRKIVLFTYLCFGLSCISTNSQIIENLEVLNFKEKIIEFEGLVIDVRTPEEFSSGYIEEATNIDYYANDFDKKLSLLSKSQPIYIYCRSGGRSSSAAKILEKLGFSKVYNLIGGIGAWNNAGYKIKKPEKRKEDVPGQLYTDLEIDKILNNKNIVLLVFSTEWCIPCRKMKPILESIQNEKPDIKVLFIDADINTDLINMYTVSGIPTLIAVKNTEIVYRHVGIISKKGISEMIDNL